MGPKGDEAARLAVVAEASAAKHTLHLKKSMGGFRGSFARIITNSDKLIGFARCKDTKSLCLVNELTDYQVTLKNGYEKLTHAYTLLLDDIPDDPGDDDKKNKSRYEMRPMTDTWISNFNFWMRLRSSRIPSRRINRLRSNPYPPQMTKLQCS